MDNLIFVFPIWETHLKKQKKARRSTFAVLLLRLLRQPQVKEKNIYCPKLLL